MNNLSEERKVVVEGVLAHIFAHIINEQELEIVIEHLELRMEEMANPKPQE